MRSAVAIALALVAPLLLSGADAELGCLPVDPQRFDEIEPRGALPDHPGWTLAVGYALDRLPRTPTMLAQDGEVTCDLTRGMDVFLGSRAAPASGVDAVRLATLALAAEHVDVLPDLVVRRASAERVAGGFLVALEAWTPRHGLVVDATARLDGDVRTSFTVRERGVGAFEASPEGWALLPGASDAALRGALHASAAKVVVAPNADGTQWRVTYFPHLYASEAEADRHAHMHLDAALASYANVTSWGFASPDPDGILDLTLDGCACIFAGLHADIHMFPRANDLLPLLPGISYGGDEAGLAELVLGHELFHHVQYGIQGWGLGQWLVEGTARFVESIHVPDVTYRPTAILYAADRHGMNGFLLTSDAWLTQHSYDWSLVWAWLYVHEGGIAFLKAVLEESAHGSGDPSVAGPAAISRAMERVPGGTFTTFAEAYHAFAAALLTRDGFVWGAPDGTQVHDWATYLVPLARERQATGIFDLPPWGIQAHDARPPPGAPAVVAYQAGPLHDARIYTLRDGAAAISPALPANVVVDADDAALLVVRTAYVNGDGRNTAGAYAVTVAR